MATSSPDVGIYDSGSLVTFKLHGAWATCYLQPYSLLSPIKHPIRTSSRGLLYNVHSQLRGGEINNGSFEVREIGKNSSDLPCLDSGVL